MSNVDEFHIKVNDYIFACFIEDVLKVYGFEKSGSGFNMDDGWRDLWYRRIGFPKSADFIPQAIPVNLPEGFDEQT